MPSLTMLLDYPCLGNLASRNALILFTLCIFSQSLLVLSQQLDPIKNICSRWDHQSAILDGTLYIDGGVEVFVDVNTNGTKLLGTQHVGINKNLLGLDITRSWNWWEKMPFGIKDNQASLQSTLPPPLISGALWPYKKFLYLYGGTTSRLNDSFTGYTAPTTDQVVMWKYDVEKIAWSPVEPQKKEGNNALPRLSSGANAVAPDQGLAFHFGGEINNGTLPAAESNVTGVSFINSFYAFNFTDESILTLSTDGLGNTSFRANAQMVNIPDVGGKGILVLMGGGFKNSSIDDTDWKGELLSMSNIAIFDIASIDTGSGTWYNQTATGDIPSPRTDFCIVIVSAPDNSSHNIFLYGGWDGVKNFDDIYVLSIPSFRWIRIFEGKDQRRSHSCHVVGKRQLMTIGGRRGKALPGECDWQPNTVSLFDMVILDWVPSFKPNGTEWHVPKTISNNIGGGLNGGATVRAPETWSPGLEKVFNPEATTSSPTPPNSATPQPTTSAVSDSQRKKLSKASIIGLSIGLSVLLLLILYLIYRFCLIACISGSNRYSRPPIETSTVPPKSTFHELLGSLGKQKTGKPAAELEASRPHYQIVHDGNRSPFEMGYEGVYDRDSLTTRPVVEKPEGNWI